MNPPERHLTPQPNPSLLVREALSASLKAKKSGDGRVWRDMNSDPEPARGWCNVLIVSGPKLKHVGWRLGIY